jgi:site-specific DNA-cytosine methylase
MSQENSKTRRGRRKTTKLPTLVTWHLLFLIREDLYWRPLTVIECERAQTLPDNYTKAVPKTRRLKAIGNGWTVDIIKHILSHCKF